MRSSGHRLSVRLAPTRRCDFVEFVVSNGQTAHGFVDISMQSEDDLYIELRPWHGCTPTARRTRCLLTEV
jgi:hypothetical protein